MERSVPPIEDWGLNALWSLTPTVLVGLVFWFIYRAIVRADSTERKVADRILAEERAKRQRLRTEAAAADSAQTDNSTERT